MNTTISFPDTAPSIGETVRVSMYNFLTGTVTDWDGIVTGHVSKDIVTVTDEDEGRDYVVPVRHVHPRSVATIAGA